MEKVGDSELSIEEWLKELSKKKIIKESAAQKLLENFFIPLDLESYEMLNSIKERKNKIKFIAKKYNISILTVEEKFKSNNEIITTLLEEGFFRLIVTIAKENINPYIDFLDSIDFCLEVFAQTIYDYMKFRNVMKQIDRKKTPLRLYGFVYELFNNYLKIEINKRSELKPVLGKRGGRYIERVSKNGNWYKKYN